jgi:hypothetical protein
VWSGVCRQLEQAWFRCDNKKMSESNATTAPCGQCSRPGIVAVNDAALCVDCYYKFEVARTLGFRIAAIGMNHAAAEMDSIAGLRNFTPRIQVPDMPKGPFILNNIKVDNSVVGSINTGNVQSIDVSVTVLKEAGNEKISDALKALAEVIANSHDITASNKDSMLDQVAYLSEQAVAAAKDRRPGMIQAALASITQGAAAVTAIATAWAAAAPLLKSYFGI